MELVRHNPLRDLTKSFGAAAAFTVITVFAFHAGAREASVSWEASPGAESYQVEVSKTKDFTDLVSQKTEKGTSLKEDLPDGKYFFHVRKIDKAGRYGPWSPTSEVNVFPAVIPGEAVEKQTITYFRQLPKISAVWRTEEQTPLFVVTVEKNGTVVSKKDTAETKIEFNVEGPGEYVVKAAPSTSGGVGEATLVKHVVVVQGKIPAPQWETPSKVRVEEGEPVLFQWKSVPEAASYRLKIWRAPTVRGQRATLVSETGGIPLTSHSAKLEPGIYIASIASEVENFHTDFNNQTVAVILNNPYKFNSYQFYARYAYSQIAYDNLIFETASFFPNQYFQGGSLMGRGNLWFKDSKLGIQVSALWGGFDYSGQLAAFSDAEGALAVRYSKVVEGRRAELRPYIGVRAWSIPMIRTSQTNTALVRFFDPILAGPVVGAVVVAPLSRRWDIEMEGQMSVPLTNSTLGNDSIGDINAEPIVNARGEISINYKVTPTVKATLGAEYDEEVFQWYRNNNPNLAESRVEMSSISAVAGVQTISEEGEENPFDAQTDFKLELKYTFLSMFYHSYLRELYSKNLPDPLVEFNTNYAGTGSLDIVRWLPRSASGFRLGTSWSSLNIDNTSYTYNEFIGQWALRFLGNPSVRLENYFGARTWMIPVVFIVASTGTNRSAGPTLVGPADTLQLRLQISKNFGIGLSGQISSPLLIMDRDSSIDSIHWEDMSYRGELSFDYRFNHFLTAGLSAGYQLDQLRYNITGGTDETSSTIVMSSPAFSIFGSYIF